MAAAVTDIVNEGRRGNGPNARPDPTIATKDAVALAVTAERDYVDGQLEVLRERLAGIDRATELRLGGIEGIPQQIEEKVRHLADLMDEKFESVQTQFKERDTRSEREARDNKLAVDAAFAAQEKQAVAQQDANTEKIDKSERSTSDTIKTNQELSRATTDALTKSLDEVKLTVAALVAAKAGVTEQRVEQRAGTSSVYGLIGAVAVLIFVSLALYAASRGGAATVLKTLMEGAA